jgi:hypothetical protein
MTEYVLNASISIITQIFSFLANYEFESRMSFDRMKFDESIAKERVNRSKDREIVFIIKNIWKFAKEHMKKSQQHQTTYANAHRITASDYQIDDQMWLSTKNIQIDKSSRKLDHKMIKSFKILKKRDSFYKLDLSKKMIVHSIFHISLLRKDSQDLVLDQIIFSSSSIIIEDKEKYHVNDIIDSRLINKTFNKRLQYKIRWIEHSSNRKWYSVENFDHAMKIVIDYHQRYLDKSSSHFFVLQSLFISLMTHLTNSFSWAQKNIRKTKNMIEIILNKMKKEMKFEIIKQISISSVERNDINTKTNNQDCFVIKTTNVERILSNQKREKNSHRQIRFWTAADVRHIRCASLYLLPLRRYSPSSQRIERLRCFLAIVQRSLADAVQSLKSRQLIF